MTTETYTEIIEQEVVDVPGSTIEVIDTDTISELGLIEQDGVYYETITKQEEYTYTEIVPTEVTTEVFTETDNIVYIQETYVIDENISTETFIDTREVTVMAEPEDIIMKTETITETVTRDVEVQVPFEDTRTVTETFTDTREVEVIDIPEWTEVIPERTVQNTEIVTTYENQVIERTEEVQVPVRVPVEPIYKEVQETYTVIETQEVQENTEVTVVDTEAMLEQGYYIEDGVWMNTEEVSAVQEEIITTETEIPVEPIMKSITETEIITETVTTDDLIVQIDESLYDIEEDGVYYDVESEDYTTMYIDSDGSIDLTAADLEGVDEINLSNTNNSVLIDEVILEDEDLMIVSDSGDEIDITSVQGNITTEETETGSITFISNENLDFDIEIDTDFI
jgi:hypothetical protein